MAQYPDLRGYLRCRCLVGQARPALIFQLAELAVPRALFQGVLEHMAPLRRHLAEGGRTLASWEVRLVRISVPCDKARNIVAVGMTMKTDQKGVSWLKRIFCWRGEGLQGS